MSVHVCTHAGDVGKLLQMGPTVCRVGNQPFTYVRGNESPAGRHPGDTFDLLMLPVQQGACPVLLQKQKVSIAKDNKLQ